MKKRLSFEAKEKMVALSGACFWFWNSFYSFLDSCGVPRQVRERYPREAYNKYQLMRNILTDTDNAEKTNIIDAIVSNFYRMRGPVDVDNLDVKRAQRLLDEFRRMVGTDPIEAEIRRQTQEKTRAAYQVSVEESRARTIQLNGLNSRFIELVSSSDISPQKRGFDLEALFFDLLAFYEFDHTKPYRTGAGEQIDGHFRYEKFDYLVEAKWTDGLTKQPDLSIFDGKIRGKAQSTRGFFLSANGFDENAIAKFSGDAPRIVLMTGEDLALVLNNQVSFDDAMKAKIDAIVRKGQILLPLRTAATRLSHALIAAWRAGDGRRHVEE